MVVKIDYEVAVSESQLSRMRYVELMCLYYFFTDNFGYKNPMKVPLSKRNNT